MKPRALQTNNKQAMEILPAEGRFLGTTTAAVCGDTAGYACDLLQRMVNEVRLLYINRPIPTRLGEVMLQADTLALLLEATAGGNDEHEYEAGDEQNDEHEDEQNDEHEDYENEEDNELGDWDFSREIRHRPAPRRDMAGNWTAVAGQMVRRSHRIYIQPGNQPLP